MKHLLFLIITTFIISGCEIKEEPINYPSEIEYFDSLFYDHFPSTTPNYYSLLQVSQDLSGYHPHVWLEIIVDQNHLDSVILHASQIAVAKYHSDDTCLLVIDRHLSPDNWLKYDKWARVPKKYDYPNKPCHMNKMPLPNFYDDDWFESNNSPTSLDNFDFYVLDAKPGIFMNIEKLPNTYYNPKGWEHGYSKGIAINLESNRLVYWADIW